MKDHNQNVGTINIYMYIHLYIMHICLQCIYVQGIYEVVGLGPIESVGGNSEVSVVLSILNNIKHCLCFGLWCPSLRFPVALLSAGCGWPLRSSVGKASSRRKQDNIMSGCQLTKMAS